MTDATWQILDGAGNACEAFVHGSWDKMAAGQLGPADFGMVSPSDLAAALGLATVYDTDTAGWYLAADRRLHVRPTNSSGASVYSYESLARVGWAVGVTTETTASLSVFWDAGSEGRPVGMEALLARAIENAPRTDAWIAAGQADFAVARGQALKRSPAAGAPMTEVHDPQDPDRFFFSPVEESDVAGLIVALVVRVRRAGEPASVSAELADRFFPAAQRNQPGLLIRTHYAPLVPPVPPMDPSRPFQAIWRLEDSGADQKPDFPGVKTVREALPGTSIRRARLSVWAIGSLSPFPEYEKPELAELEALDPTIVLGERQVLFGEPVYERPRFLLRREAAERIVRVNQDLRRQGCRLKILDAYRPLSVTQRLWNLRPDHMRPSTPYLAAPNRGSRHNRGAAVDCTLTDMDGKELEMPSGYLVFDETAHRDCPGMSPKAKRNMDILTAAMAREGFTTIREEWWHFDAPHWERCRVLDVPLWPPEPQPSAAPAPPSPSAPQAERTGSVERTSMVPSPAGESVVAGPSLPSPGETQLGNAQPREAGPSVAAWLRAHWIAIILSALGLVLGLLLFLLRR